MFLEFYQISVRSESFCYLCFYLKDGTHTYVILHVRNRCIINKNITLRTNLAYFILILLLASCTGNTKSNTSPPPLFPQPQKVKLNTDGGYSINTLSGDSITPIILENGDTLITGTPIPAAGKVINVDSVEKPETIKSELINFVNAYPNVHKIPEKLKVVTVNHDSLKTFFLEDIAENDTTHYALNSTGEKVKTGIPIPAQGTIIKTFQPIPVKAGTPGFKDAAIGNLKYLDAYHGLASHYIESILEDKKGNIWFSTNNGAIMYNGESFAHFTENEGLCGNEVNKIIADKNGNIWIATSKGVSMYNGKFFTQFTEKEGLINNHVLDILEDKNGNIWFGTYEKGVSMYNGESFTHFTEKEGLSGNEVENILEDKKGNLWFSTLRNGVNMYNGESFTHFVFSTIGELNTVFSMLEDKKGNLWFGTALEGVSMYNGESFTYFTEEEGLSHNDVYSILEDKSGNIWFGTYEGGVSMYNGESFTHFTTKEGLSNNEVISIMEDISGNLWFGTGKGVSIYNRESYSHFTEKDGLISNGISSMLEDKSGNLWFVTYDGICMYNGESFAYFSEDEVLFDYSYESIFEDKNGNHWFGSFLNGVIMYNGESLKQFTENEGLNDNEVVSIIEDKNENFWFGTDEGASMYNGEFFTHFTTEEGLSNEQINSIIEDKNDNLWFGTDGEGVSKYNGESFTRFTEKEGLSNNHVNSILEDKNGNLWFGTHGGVNMFNGESFTYFTEKEGLSSNIIKSIIEDKNGNIWFGTAKGINMYNGEFFTHFTEKDGLNSNDVSSMLEDKNGNLWFGTYEKGVSTKNVLDLNNYKDDSNPPKIYLRSLDINERFIDYRNSSDSLLYSNAFTEVQPFENYPLDLKLPHDQNHLTFHFSAIDWIAPQKIRYSFKLEGLNNKWSHPSNEAKADFRQIPYGDYTFEVRAIGASGKWSDSFEYSFSILPPWWHTWWAKIGYLIAVVFLVWSYVRWRTAKLKQRQLELENEVDNATEEIRNQKDKIEKEKEKSEELLLNILPAEVAEELKEKGHSDAQLIDQVTVLFTDFKGFTALSEQLSPNELVADLHACFSEFDRISEKYGIEKIKTIGDAYMAAGGLPSPNKTHAQDVVKASLEMAEVIEKTKSIKTAANQPFFEVRLGVHSGPVVAGIVGVKKFQYDIWGDTVNTASRMESSGVPGKVNISENTYKLLKDDSDFIFKSRGKIEAKGKGEMEMYFVEKNRKQNK